MQDQDNRDLHEDRGFINLSPPSPSCAPPENTPEHSTSIPAIVAGKKLLNDRLYSPETFRTWIKAGITAAREDYQETTEIDRTDAMKTNRRIFECLDAATEKNLERIRDKKAALELLDAVNWDDLMGGGYVDTRRRGAAKQASGERYQGFGNFKQMTVEKARMKVERAADEAGAKEIKLMNSEWRVEGKEIKEKEAKEARQRAREDERLRDETWRYPREQDLGAELDEDDLP